MITVGRSCDGMGFVWAGGGRGLTSGVGFSFIPRRVSDGCSYRGHGVANVFFPTDDVQLCTHIHYTEYAYICRRGNFRSRLRGSSSAVRPSVRRCTGRHARAAAGTPLDGARSPAVLNNARRSASRRGAAHAGDVASPLDLSINPLGRRRRRRRRRRIHINRVSRWPLTELSVAR